VRILHVGNESVVAPLRGLGHEVVSVFERWPETNRPGTPFDIRPLWEGLGQRADLLLVVDTLGRQTLPYGVEDLPVLRVYYAIDVHLNLFWQIHYGALFDLVFLAQKDYVPIFTGQGVAARWLPWAIDPEVFCDRGTARPYDLCFVGTVDPDTRPKRSAAVELLKRRFGMVTFGERVDERLPWRRMAEVFGRSKIVFNEAIMGELNFRVFEAMACGAMLLTEDIGNGLRDLFSPGEHMDVYDCGSLLSKVEYYLKHDKERERLARAGAREVAREHTLVRRMENLMESVRELLPAARGRTGSSYHLGIALQRAIARGLVDPAPGLSLAAQALLVAVEDGRSAQAAVSLARILAVTGKNREALAVLERARGFDPSDVSAWFLAAELELREGNPGRALGLFRGGIWASPFVSDTTKKESLAALEEDLKGSRALLGLARVMREAGIVFMAGFVPKVDAGLPWTAYDYYMRAVERDPKNEEAANELADFLQFLGLHEFAVRYRRVSVALRPWDVEARKRLVDALARSYLLEEAEQEERVISCLRGTRPCGDEGQETEARRVATAARAAEVGEARGRQSALEMADDDEPEVLRSRALAALNLQEYAAARGYLNRLVQYADATREEVEELFRLLDELQGVAGGD